MNEVNKLIQLYEAKDYSGCHEFLNVLDSELAKFSEDDLVNIASIAHKTRHYHIATKIFEKLLESKPNNPVLFNELGNSLMQLGQFENSIEQFKLALELQSNYPIAHSNLAISYSRIGQIELSRQHFKKALTLEPRADYAVIGLILTEERERNFDIALELCQNYVGLLENNVRFLHAWANILLGLKKYESALEKINLALQVDDKYINALYTKSEILIKLEKYFEAYTSAHIANGFCDQKVYSVKQFKKEIKEELDISRKIVHHSPFEKLAVDHKQPIFILGSPRSGTTLLASMLERHQKIINAGELNLIPKLRVKVQEWTGQDLSWVQLLNSVHHPKNSTCLDRLRIWYQEEIEQLKNANSGQIIIDKLPFNTRFIGLIRAVAPGAAIIHMVRDAREVAISAFFQNFQSYIWHSYNLEDALTEWVYSNFYAEESAQLFQVPYLKVHYEDLVLDAEKNLKNVYEFLQLDFEAKSLEFYNNNSAANTASYQQVREKLYTHSLKKAQNFQPHYDQMTEFLKQFFNEESKFSNSSFEPHSHYIPQGTHKFYCR